MAPQVGLEPFGLKWCRAAAHTLASLCISARTDVFFFCHRQRRRLFPLRQQPCFARCFPPWVIGLCRISATKKSDTLLCTWFFGSSSWARTNDPAVNSRMLCQLSYWGIYDSNPNRFGLLFRQLSTFPCSLPQSIIDVKELNFRVRDGNGWGLLAIVTGFFSPIYPQN